MKICSQDMLVGHNQLLIVVTENWTDYQGRLHFFERSNNHSPWISMETSIPVVLGKNGLAWGIGLHSKEINNLLPFKQEGDLKSPAGIFSLGPAFGFAPIEEMKHLKIDYLSINSFTEAVDDPLSHYYNQIVNSQKIIPDWNSSEKMSEEPLYAFGLVINHNYPNPQPKLGSAIFFHIWKSNQKGTAGCTAMSDENLSKLLFWLDKNKNPLLIQMPLKTYLNFEIKWNFPSINPSTNY